MLRILFLYMFQVNTTIHPPLLDMNTNITV